MSDCYDDNCEKTPKEYFEERILKIHNFLPGCPVKIKSLEYTKKCNWANTRHKTQIGLTGVVVEVHNSVLEAIKVKICKPVGIYTREYWNFKDLEELPYKEKNISVLFDPNNLVI